MLDRRELLKLSAVAAAGSALGGIPAIAAPTMDKVRMGTMNCGVVGAGLVNLGRFGPDAAAQGERMIHAALDNGINFFDTGQVYGNNPDTKRFESETVLGKAVAKRRAQAYIATKFGYSDVPPQTAIGFANLEAQCDISLKKLGTDYIDMYQSHNRGDGKVPWEDVLGQLGRLVEKGKIRNIGWSSGDVNFLREIQAIAVKNRLPLTVGTQSGMSLLSRGAEKNLLPTLIELNIKLIPTGPLASGFLTGKYKPNEAPPAGSAFSRSTEAQRAQRLTERNFKIINALTDYARSHNRTMLELAFGWLISHKGMGPVIAGISNEEQAKQNGNSGGWRMTPAQVAEATKIAASFDSSVLTPAAP